MRDSLRVGTALAAAFTAAASASSPKPVDTSAVCTGDCGYKSDSKPTPPAQCPTEGDGRWNYARSADKMRGTSSRRAVLESTNAIDVGPPYGAIHLAIGVLESDSGDSVVLMLDRGQLGCATDRCNISYRADGEAVVDTHAYRVGDTNRTMIFGMNGGYYVKEWLSIITCHKHITIEVPIFEHVSHQFEFDLAGLKWPPADDAGSGSAIE